MAENGNSVGSRSALMMTPPTLRMRKQGHALDSSRFKVHHPVLIHTCVGHLGPVNLH
jgi:hypothetical protein